MHLHSIQSLLVITIAHLVSCQTYKTIIQRDWDGEGESCDRPSGIACGRRPPPPRPPPRSRCSTITIPIMTTTTLSKVTSPGVISIDWKTACVRLLGTTTVP